MRSAKIHAAKQILLVEDEPANRAILSCTLRDAGYVVDEAADGKAAWDILKSHAGYDVVITDRRMPNMDGLELARKMKKESGLRGIPIIMQTSARALPEVSEGIKAGVYYYLAKPYEEETIIALARSAVRDREKTSLFEKRVVHQKKAFGTIVQGEFHLKTPEEAENVAFLLGSLFPRPDLAITGLFELLINAIEHGNLGIGFENKASLVTQSLLDSEVRTRLARPEYQDRKVVVHYSGTVREISVTIRDDGEGFDWKPYLEAPAKRPAKATGHGIAKANLISFDSVVFSDKGNEVQVSAAR